jgi:hypothetical protein
MRSTDQGYACALWSMSACTTQKGTGQCRPCMRTAHAQNAAWYLNYLHSTRTKYSAWCCMGTAQHTYARNITHIMYNKVRGELTLMMRGVTHTHTHTNTNTNTHTHAHPVTHTHTPSHPHTPPPRTHIYTQEVAHGGSFSQFSMASGYTACAFLSLPSNAPFILVSVKADTHLLITRRNKCATAKVHLQAQLQPRRTSKRNCSQNAPPSATTA